MTTDDKYFVKFVLKVRDYGMGIPKDRISKLFFNFSKLEAHQKANPGGVGLGLSICKSLVEAMGGSI